MREIDELRTPSAGALLRLWRESREEDPLERALLCNARILAQCCFCRGEAVYMGEMEVLEDLTGREIEGLLVRLGRGGGKLEAGQVNPQFDPERFRALEGGR